MTATYPTQPEDRALWHLELLGCYSPDDAVAPYVPSPFEYLHDQDDGEYIEYHDRATCWACGGNGNEIRCCDDLCHGQDWCMHGDNYPCPECGGDGFL